VLGSFERGLADYLLAYGQMNLLLVISQVSCSVYYGDLYISMSQNGESRACHSGGRGEVGDDAIVKQKEEKTPTHRLCHHPHSTCPS